MSNNIRSKYNWNPVYNLIIEIKDKYKDQFDLDTYNFQTWIYKLNEIGRYNDFINNVTIRQEEDFLLIKYHLYNMAEDFWLNENNIYRECRSIVIDLKREEIVVAPWKKFFNLNETPNNKVEIIKEKINKAESVEITNKLDGSMQTCRYYNGEIKLFGSQGLTEDISWRVKDGYRRLSNNYKKMIKENPQYTFMFENISPKNMHVVKYSEEEAGLYLNGMRNVYTGNQLSYKEIKEYSNKYNVPMVEIEDRTLEEIIELSRKEEGNKKEGWVVNIDGHLVKLKCDDYVEIHKVIGKVVSPNTIIKQVEAETFDDFYSKVPPNYQERVMEIAQKVFNYVKEEREKINMYSNKMAKEVDLNNRKETMIWINKNIPNKYKGNVRNIYLNKDIYILKSYSGKYVKGSDIGLREDEEEN